MERRLCLKKSELKPTAPKARNMKARGKRGARRPWDSCRIILGRLKVRNILPSYYALSELRNEPELTRGDALRFRYALAPGFHIPRLWHVRIAN